MSLVRIPPTLRAETGGRVEVEVAGTNVRDLLEDLTARFPALRGQLEHANVYVDRQDIRTLDGLDTEVAEGAEVTILPAVAGG
jgi:molybdopterin converting factor small subunit